MSLHVDVQVAIDTHMQLPTRQDIHLWAQQAIAPHVAEGEMTVRIVDEQESAELNQRYRHKQGPTNVLSFPFDAQIPMETTLLGDIVICAPVIEREAQQQCKNIQAHWAHMVVHGSLHLLGYDHIQDEQAQQMESMEIDCLRQLGFSNPYEANSTNE